MSWHPARRLAAGTGHELRLLRRHGVVAAAAVVAVVWAVVLRLLPVGARTAGLELVTFGQLAVLGYSFAGAAVLLGKGEGSLLALTVTPLRLSEQIAARVLALTGVTALATLVVVLGSGTRPAAGWSFAAGTAAAAAVALVTSLAVVAPHRSVSRWLIPSVPPMLVLALPAAAYLGTSGPWLWLLPTQGALVLLRGPAGAAEAAVALLASAGWVIGLGIVAERRFARFVAAADA